MQGDQEIELATMPIPEYEHFLAALSAAGWTDPVALTFETSRGCWWGQKHHCRFCGVNGRTLRFRAKSPQRAINEIRIEQTRCGVGVLRQMQQLGLIFIEHDRVINLAVRTQLDPMEGGASDANSA